MSTSIVEVPLQLEECKMDNGEEERIPVCEKCGSTNVQCYSAYSTAGDSLEYCDFTHKCLDCGHEKSDFAAGCYGYSHDYYCPMCGAFGCST